MEFWCLDSFVHFPSCTCKYMRVVSPREMSYSKQGGHHPNRIKTTRRQLIAFSRSDHYQSKTKKKEGHGIRHNHNEHVGQTVCQIQRSVLGSAGERRPTIQLFQNHTSKRSSTTSLRRENSIAHTQKAWQASVFSLKSRSKLHPRLRKE